MGIEQDLLPNNLRRHKACRLIRDLIVGKIAGTLRKYPDNLLHKQVEPITFQRRNGNNLPEIMPPAIFVDYPQQLLLFSADAIDFIQQKESGRARLSDQVQNEFIFAVRLACHIVDHQDQIATFQRLPHFGHHLAAERTIGFVHARGINEDHLTPCLVFLLW